MHSVTRRLKRRGKIIGRFSLTYISNFTGSLCFRGNVSLPPSPSPPNFCLPLERKKKGYKREISRLADNSGSTNDPEFTIVTPPRAYFILPSNPRVILWFMKTQPRRFCSWSARKPVNQSGRFNRSAVSPKVRVSLRRTFPSFNDKILYSSPRAPFIETNAWAPINTGPNRIQLPAPEESLGGPGMPVEPTWHEGCRATGEYAQLPG